MTATISGAASASKQAMTAVTQSLENSSATNQNRDIDTRNASPQEFTARIQKESLEPDLTSGTAVTGLNIKDVVEFITELQNMSGDDELPGKGSVLDITV